MLPWWRLGGEQGNKGKKVKPPTGQPTHTSGPTANAYSRSDGYYSSARRVPFRAVCVFSFHFVFNFIAPRPVCGCSTSSLLSREACTAWQDVCVQLCVGTVVVLPAYVCVAATLLFYVHV